MKKLLTVLLILMLALPLNCSASANPAYDYIISLLENGEYDMAIHVIEGLKLYPDSNSAQDSGAVSGERTVQLSPETNGSDWMFNIDLINDGDQSISLESLKINDWNGSEPFGEHFFAGSDLERIGLGDFVLQSGEGRMWNDAHPVVPEFNRRDYTFCFRTENGGEMLYIFAYDMQSSVPAQQPADWQFPAYLKNETDQPIELVAVDITDLLNNERLGTYIFEDEEALANIGLGGLTLAPGESTVWCDGHPFVTDFNGREYRFHFRNASGESHTLTFFFDNLDQQNTPKDYSSDPGRDLRTLRHDAAYQTEVAPGVYWAPAAELGQSRFSNMDIHKMLNLSPEEKQAEIATLYEALQLYQIGNFTAADDNIRIAENGINWEHHKPGYHAVRTNCGCCATDSNWLRYILDGDYDEIGFIAISQRDGSGHVYNYILHNGWYYFIDLTHYRADGGIFDSAVEDGNPASYFSTDFILGNIHKAESVKAYVDYVQQNMSDAPGLMFMYTSENVLAVDSLRTDGRVQIVYEDAGGLLIEVIFDDPGDKLDFAREASPENLPDWSSIPDAVF